MNKNVLILSSSPRRGGNSDRLCDAFLQGCKDAGHTVEKIFLKDFYGCRPTDVNSTVANIPYKT